MFTIVLSKQVASGCAYTHPVCQPHCLSLCQSVFLCHCLLRKNTRQRAHGSWVVRKLEQTNNETLGAANYFLLLIFKNSGLLGGGNFRDVLYFFVVFLVYVIANWQPQI